MSQIFTFRLADAAATGSNHMRIDDSLAASPGFFCTTGWTVFGVTAGHLSALSYGTERAAATFGSSNPITGLPNNSLGDCMRSERKVTGRFPAGNWTFNVDMGAVTKASGQKASLLFRMLAGADPTGADANEIHGIEETPVVGPILAPEGLQWTFGKTFDPGDFTVDSEYLFFQVACRVALHGITSPEAGEDLLFWIESSNSYIESTAFVPIEDDAGVPYGQQIGV